MIRRKNFILKIPKNNASKRFTLLIEDIDKPKQSPFIDFDTMEFYRKRFTCW